MPRRHRRTLLSIAAVTTAAVLGPAIASVGSAGIEPAGATTAEDQGGTIHLYTHEQRGDERIARVYRRQSAFSPKAMDLTGVTYAYHPATGELTARVHVRDFHRVARKHGHPTVQSLSLDVGDVTPINGHGSGLYADTQIAPHSQVESDPSCARVGRSDHQARINLKTDLAVLTVKIGGCMPAGDTIQVNLMAEQFSSLWPGSNGKGHNGFHTITDDFAPQERFTMPS